MSTSQCSWNTVSLGHDCVMCEKSYAYLKDLKRHIRDTHHSGKDIKQEPAELFINNEAEVMHGSIKVELPDSNVTSIYEPSSPAALGDMKLDNNDDNRISNLSEPNLKDAFHMLDGSDFGDGKSGSSCSGADQEYNRCSLRYECALCGKSYIRLRDLRLHIRNANHDGPDQKYSQSAVRHQCAMCEKSYAYLTDLQRHMRDANHDRIDPTNLAGSSDKSATIAQQKYDRSSSIILTSMLQDRDSEKFICDAESAAHTATSEINLKVKSLDKITEPRHGCTICSKRFFKPKDLKRHMMVHCPDLMAYVCKKCGKGFRSNSRLYNHRLLCLTEEEKEAYPGLRHHYNRLASNGSVPRIEPVREACVTCGKLITTGHMPVHIEMHVRELPFACIQCGVRFKQIRNLVTHQLTHSDRYLGKEIKQEPSELFINNDADAAASSFKVKPLSPDSNATSIYESSSRAGLDMDCDNEKDYDNPDSMDPDVADSFQMKTEIDGDDVNSGASFRNDSKNEVQTITKSTISCSLCGKTYRSKDSFYVHMRKHHKRFVCSRCGKSFFSNSVLMRHQFQCKVTRGQENEESGSNFSTSTSQNCDSQKLGGTSLKYNRGTLRHECAVCDKSYIHKQDLNRHIRQTNHRDTFNIPLNMMDVKKSKERIHICGVCSKRFGSPSDLRRHMMVHYPDLKTLVCKKCGAGFRREYQLKDHRLTCLTAEEQAAYPALRHHRRLFVCYRCGQSFTRNRNLVTHRLNHCDANNSDKRKPKVKGKAGVFKPEHDNNPGCMNLNIKDSFRKRKESGCKDANSGASFSNEIEQEPSELFINNDAEAAAGSFKIEPQSSDSNATSIYEQFSPAGLDMDCDNDDNYDNSHFNDPDVTNTGSFQMINGFDGDNINSEASFRSAQIQKRNEAKNEVPAIAKSTISCSLCDKMYSSRDSFYVHMRKSHKRFMCSHCGKSYFSNSVLMRHQFQCKATSGQKNNESGFNSSTSTSQNCDSRKLGTFEIPLNTTHVKKIKDRTHVCAVCSKQFGSPSDLRRHMMVHYPDLKTLVCKKCGAGFRREYQLKDHRLTCLTVEEQAAYPALRHHRRLFVCNQCNQSFTRNRNLVAHQLNHCDQNNTSKRKLKVTSNACVVKPKHNNNPNFKDLDINNRFLIKHESDCKDANSGPSFRFVRSRKRKEAADEVTSAAKNNISCSLCCKLFSSWNNFYVHRRKHHRRFACSCCGKSFCSNLVLMRHQWQCKTVSRQQTNVFSSNTSTFTRQNGDSRKFSGTSLKYNQGTLRYECAVCEKSYIHRKDLKRHYVQTNHGSTLEIHSTTRHATKTIKERKNVCSVCSKRFEKPSDLGRHMMVHYPDLKTYVCKKCGEGFRVYSHLYDHRLTCLTENEQAAYSALRHHNRLRLSIDNFQQIEPVLEACATCGKHIIAEHMPAHMQMHSGERRFVCDQCGRGFMRRISLVTHRLTHDPNNTGRTESIVIAGDSCVDRCEYASTIGKRQTRRMTEELGTTAEVESQMFACRYCYKGFKMIYDLDEHVVTHTQRSRVGESNVIALSHAEHSRVVESNVITSTHAEHCGVVEINVIPGTVVEGDTVPTTSVT